MGSRQRRWQLAKKARGLCTCCGRRKILRWDGCKVCVGKFETYRRVKRGEDPLDACPDLKYFEACWTAADIVYIRTGQYSRSAL